MAWYYEITIIMIWYRTIINKYIMIRYIHVYPHLSGSLLTEPHLPEAMGLNWDFWEFSGFLSLKWFSTAPLPKISTRFKTPARTESWTKSPASIAFLFAPSVEAVQLSCLRWMDGWTVIRILGEHPGRHPSHLSNDHGLFASHGNRSLCPVLSEGSDGTCLPAMCETQSVHWSDTAKTQVVDCFF